MSNFQRMIVIPQEEYLNMTSMQNIKEPLAQHFHNLENRYKSEETEKDPYRRLVMQSDTLDQMKQVKDQIRNSLTISTPKPYLSRANALFQTVESFLRFNDKGEIYSDDGNILPGSRIEDLIQHAVRDRRRNLTPTGWTDFLTILHDHNVPKSILNRNTLDEMEAIPLATVKMEPTIIEEPTPSSRQSRKREKAPQRFQPARKLKSKLTESKNKFDFVKKFKDE